METLTFLFTDIEGSTALLGRLGDDDYAQVLAGLRIPIESVHPFRSNPYGGSGVFVHLAAGL